MQIHVTYPFTRVCEGSGGSGPHLPPGSPLGCDRSCKSQGQKRCKRILIPEQWLMRPSPHTGTRPQPHKETWPRKRSWCTQQGCPGHPAENQPSINPHFAPVWGSSQAARLTGFLEQCMSLQPRELPAVSGAACKITPPRSVSWGWESLPSLVLNVQSTARDRGGREGQQ